MNEPKKRTLEHQRQVIYYSVRFRNKFLFYDFHLRHFLVVHAIVHYGDANRIISRRSCRFFLFSAALH